MSRRRQRLIMGSIGALAGVTAAAGLSWPEARVLAARHALMASRSHAQPLPSQAQPPDDAVASTNASDADVVALIDAGRYVDAEKLGLARVSALDAARSARHTSDATASDAEIADTLDLVLLARHLGRRLTQPDTVALAERALRIREAAADGADSPRLASTLVLAGLARAAHRQPEEARRAAARARAMRERSLGPDHVDVANALNAIAWIERISGRYEDAKDAATRALAIARRAERPAGRETAASLSILAYAAHGVGDIDTAVPLFEEGVGIEERFYGASHPAFLYSLLQLGNVYWDAGDLERSRDARERAVRGLERIPGTEYRLAFELMLHSNWMNRIGDYAASLAVAERAAAFAERAAGPRSALAAAALDQVAITHGLLGNYASAIAINQKAVALWSESQGPDSQHAATAWRTLAVSYEDAGRIDEALEAIAHALANPAFAKEPIRASEAMLVKASLLVTRGRLDEARTVLSGFHRVNEQIAYFLGRVDLANAFTLQGRVERQQGQPARAVTFYRDALRLTEQNLGSTHPFTAVKRAELAGVLAETGEYSEARGLLSAGERASLDHLRLLARALPDQAALTFAATRTSGLNLAVTLAAAAPGGGADIDLAFELLIRGRTVILDEMAARHQAVLHGGDTALRERWMTLNRARTRLANLIVRGPEQQPIDRYQALVVRTRETRDRAERDLAEASAAFRQELRRTRAGATEVLAHLPAGAALISYVRYTRQPIAADSHRGAPAAQTTPPQAYAAFVARSGGRVDIVPLGEADRIDAAIDAWRTRIRDELTSAGLASRRTEATYREAGSALRALVWDPVQSRLGNASTVFIVPDGALHLVDLSTLPAGETGYLADAPVVLHYMLAERDLLQSSSPAAGNSLLALGAPDFDKAERPTATPTPRIALNGASPASHIASAGASSLRGAAACEAALASRFDPLPATAVEVRHIADLWRRRRPGEVVLLDGARASETAVKTLARGRRVLHLATHGFFLDRNCAAPGTRGAGSANQRTLEESPLLRSGLVLAGANGRTRAHAEADANDDDGILTAEEIAGLDLSGAQWAVLSACDTGRGDWQAGEGVLGLRRSFQMAGARTVILSLWPVLDSVTARWMTALYRSKWTAHRTTAAAVRDANRALLAERRANGESTHPLYWSGFIATGDWR